MSENEKRFDAMHAKISADLAKQSPAAPPINWSALTPREVFDALKAAPRVAGPWTPGHARPNEQWFRHRAPVKSYAVGVVLVHGQYYAGIPGGGIHATLAEAQAEADAHLRAAGYVLVDEEGG